LATASGASRFSIGISTCLVSTASTIIALCYVAFARDAEEDITRITFRNTIRLAPIGLCYGVSDICVYVAVGNLTASVYTVMRQIKMPLTAVLSIAILHRNISRLHIALICQLTLLILAFQLSLHEATRNNSERLQPDERHTALAGLCATLGGTICNACAGIYQELLWRDQRFPMVTSFVMYLPFNALLGVAYAVTFEIDIVLGPGGPFTGWGLVVVTAAAVYFAKAWISSCCTKYMGTLARSLCSSSATVSVYIVSLPLGFAIFDPVAMALSISIACCIYVYEQLR